MEAKQRKKIILPIVIAIILIVGGWYVYTSIKYNSTHEETDNAQIEGDIVPIIPRTSGYITQINFSDNQQIKKGDTLFLIDNRELNTKVAQAEAALENAMANLAAAESMVNTGQANLSVNEANAAAAKENIDNAKARLEKSNKDFVRYANLLEKKSITRQQYDASEADKLSGEAQLAANQKQYMAAINQTGAAKAQIINYTRQTAVAKSVIEQRQKDLEYAKLQYSYAAVTAPADGYTYKKIIQVGQYVQPGTQLFYMITSNKMWVVANFKETQIKNLQIGQKAEISVDALGGKKIQATIASFSKTTGSRLTLLPPDNATGNFVKVVQRVPVKLLFEETDSAVLSKLSVGMNVTVTVTTK